MPILCITKFSLATPGDKNVFIGKAENTVLPEVIGEVSSQHPDYYTNDGGIYENLTSEETGDRKSSDYHGGYDDLGNIYDFLNENE